MVLIYGGMQWWTRQARAPRIQFSLRFAFFQSKMLKDSDVFLLMNPYQHVLVLSTAIAILWWLEVEQFECMAIWIYCDLNGCGVCIQNHLFRAVKGGSPRRLDLKKFAILQFCHDDEDDDSRQANLQCFCIFSHQLHQNKLSLQKFQAKKTRGLTAQHLQTRCSWLNCALGGEEAMYLVSIVQQWLVLYNTESVY